MTVTAPSAAGALLIQEGTTLLLIGEAVSASLSGGALAVTIGALDGSLVTLLSGGVALTPTFPDLPAGSDFIDFLADAGSASGLGANYIRTSRPVIRFTTGEEDER